MLPVRLSAWCCANEVHCLLYLVRANILVETLSYEGLYLNKARVHQDLGRINIDD